MLSNYITSSSTNYGILILKNDGVEIKRAEQGAIHCYFMCFSPEETEYRSVKDLKLLSFSFQSLIRPGKKNSVQ
jgi:hypothetical protein